jgi:hypothetical protein
VDTSEGAVCLTEPSLVETLDRVLHSGTVCTLKVGDDADGES